MVAGKFQRVFIFGYLKETYLFENKLTVTAFLYEKYHVITFAHHRYEWILEAHKTTGSCDQSIDSCWVIYCVTTSLLVHSSY